MLDKRYIGHRFPDFSTTVETGRLKFFAKAIGENDPIYFDEEAARAAGHRDIPAPPTFLIVLTAEAPNSLPVVDLLGMDIARVLHGSQEFEYRGFIYAGDVISVTTSITDMFDKKNGAMDFVVLEHTFTNQDGAMVARCASTLIHRTA
ncbi:MAG: MaoC family dehydratase N-terminal domain-containing protein [Pseudomonadales bacterium]